MNFNDDDFREFLYGNFPDDYRSYTKQDIEDSAKTSIINRHERTYGIWRSLASEPWIRAFYGNRLPSELLSGQLNLIDFRERVVRMVCQPTIYMNNEVIALRMQYPTTMPNMVYSLNPYQEISRYSNMLERAGYDEDNLKKAVESKEKGLLYMSKMQAIGVSEENAKGLMAKAENINIMEQFSAINEKMRQAQTPEEYAKQAKQLDAFLEVNGEHLYQNREELHNLNSKLKQTDKAQKLKQQINKIKTKDTNIESPSPKETISPEDKSIRPPFLEDLSQHNASDGYGIKNAEGNFGIYDYMNNRMDAMVDEQLKNLDKRLSAQKEALGLNSKSAQSAGAEISAKSAPTISGALRNHIQLPEDMQNWSSDYVLSRAETDEKWRTSMSKSLDIVDNAAMQSKDLEDFKKRIKADFEKQYTQARTNLNQELQHHTHTPSPISMQSELTYASINKRHTR